MAPGAKLHSKWVIDTHGMVDALTTTRNSARAAIIDAIECGEMHILKPVSDEISKLYPHLWAMFKAIKSKKYLPISVAVIAAANSLAETYGASILGSIPSGDHFEAVAAARIHKCTLVSAGKALSHCSSIVSKCGLPQGSVVSITAI